MCNEHGKYVMQLRITHGEAGTLQSISLHTHTESVSSLVVDNVTKKSTLFNTKNGIYPDLECMYGA